MRPAFKIMDNWGAMILLLLAITLPVYGPWMVDIEGRFFPVSTPLTVILETTVDGGINIKFTYTKLRTCDLLGVEARKNGQPVDFYPALGQPASITHRPGPQVSQIWHLAADSMKGIQIFWVHRCHPFWQTVTKAFDSTVPIIR